MNVGSKRVKGVLAALLGLGLGAGGLAFAWLHLQARRNAASISANSLLAASHGRGKTAIPTQTFVSAAPAQTFTFAAIAKYLQGGNNEVVVGHDGWLFYRHGLAHVVGPGFLVPAFMAPRARIGGYPDPRVAMRDWHAQLQKRGITLVLLPIPDKASLYPEQLWPGYHGPPPNNPSFGAWKQEMERDGLRVFDPTSILMQAKKQSKEWLYLPDDSHWTPRATQLCAQGLAQWIKRTFTLPVVTPTSLCAALAQVAPPHDLAGLIQLAPNQHRLTVKEIPLRYVYDSQREIQGQLGKPPPAAILIIGDSYAGQYTSMRASLAAQLSYELQRPVETLAVPNGGSWGARFRLRDEIRQGFAPLKGKKLVIWEFAARDLSSGVWKDCALPPTDLPPKALSATPPRLHP